MPIKLSNRTDIPSILQRRTPEDIQHEIQQIENMAFDPPALSDTEVEQARKAISAETMSHVVGYANAFGFESVNDYIDQACAVYNESCMND